MKSTLVISLAGALLSGAPLTLRAYDPLALPSGTKGDHIDLSTTPDQKGRVLPLRIYLPPDTNPAPVVLFSHGLGGSREGSSFLGDHWAGRGYVVVCVQHPGSDTSVWQGKPLAERMASMKRAASAENFLMRVNDIHIVLDQLASWSNSRTSVLAGRLNLQRVGMSGHSFGAITTQAVSGERFPMGGNGSADPRIKAAIMFSPSSPHVGDPKEAFGQVHIPWMLMTGTKDTAPIGQTTLEDRFKVFPALPVGDKYELVLKNAEHFAFTDRPLPGDKEPRNPNHHRVILALSTAFWDTYLRQNASARSWLTGDGPRSVLESEDRWQKK